MTRARPYPVAALAEALGIDPGDTAALAQAVQVDRSWIKRYRHRGLTEQQADRWATAAGLHPLTVWPRWADDTLPPAALANVHKTRCPRGHPYDGRDSRGFRVCFTCRIPVKRQVIQLTSPAPHPGATVTHMATKRSSTLKVRVPADTHDRIRQAADQAGISVSAWVCMTLTHTLDAPRIYFDGSGHDTQPRQDTAA